MTDQILCRYYLHGACKFGSECRFSHDFKKMPNMVCTHYLQGFCAYGDKCRYDHIRPEWSRDDHAQQSGAYEAPPVPRPPIDDLGEQLPISRLRLGDTTHSCSSSCHAIHHVASVDQPFWQRQRQQQSVPVPVRLSAAAAAGSTADSRAFDAQQAEQGRRGHGPGQSACRGAGYGQEEWQEEEEHAAWEHGEVYGEYSGDWSQQGWEAGGEGAEWGEEWDDGRYSWGEQQWQGGEGGGCRGEGGGVLESRVGYMCASRAGEGPEEQYGLQYSTSLSAQGYSIQERRRGCMGGGSSATSADPAPAWHPALSEQGTGARPAEGDQDAWEGMGSTPPVPPSQRSLCLEYLLSGCCTKGGACKLVHSAFCEHCQRYALHPHDSHAAAQHSRECAARHARVAARARSAHVECAICLERVLEKEAPRDRKFGLLACSHPFCLGCIRSWREKVDGPADVDSALRTCPVCRTSSYFVTPSTTWPETQEEKDLIIEGYKAKLGSIDCKHFAFGEGSCPFGTSCFYRHAYKDGRLEEPCLRRAADEEGEVRVLQQVRLSDFLAASSAGGRVLGRR